MKFFVSLGLAAALATAAVQAAEMPLKGAALLPQAKISLKDARAKALAKEPGVIVDQELEKEKQGSGLVYTFDVKRGHTIHEVNVDAKTGKIVEDSIDTGND